MRMTLMIIYHLKIVNNKVQKNLKLILIQNQIMKKHQHYLKMKFKQNVIQDIQMQQKIFKMINDLISSQIFSIL
jgi:hypothetical protein